MQLSRMGVGAGISELVEGGGARTGGGEDGESSEEYDSDLETGTAADKSPTAEDFGDITELAEEGEGAVRAAREIASRREGLREERGGETKEALFQRGMAFAQAQLSRPSGSGLGVVSMETDDYDEDSEDVPVSSSQSLPSNEEGLSLSQQPDSGYDSFPLSDPASLDPSPPSLSDHTSQSPIPPLAPPTSLAKMEVEGGDKEMGKIESAIPYLIPKDMTLEQLHAKVSPPVPFPLIFLLPPPLMQVKQLFPGFVPNSVLRFCSLLGAPKISVAAKQWVGAKRPAKKPPRTEEVDWQFEFAPPPPPHKLLDTDEVRLPQLSLTH